VNKKIKITFISLDDARNYHFIIYNGAGYSSKSRLTKCFSCMHPKVNPLAGDACRRQMTFNVQSGQPGISFKFSNKYTYFPLHSKFLWQCQHFKT